MLVSLSKAQIWPPETKSETTVFEFFYLCVNSSLEALIKIEVISFLRDGPFYFWGGGGGLGNYQKKIPA